MESYILQWAILPRMVHSGGKVAEKPEEVTSLLEVGFEYVCQKDNLIFLRKRK